MKYFIISLLFITLSSSVFAGDIKSYLITEKKDFKIEMDTKNPENQETFSFSDYDLPTPVACQQVHIYCYEKIIITGEIKKEWEVTSIPPIWDKTLSPQEFSNFYPDLEENQTINDWSKPSDKWIVQRILYERGLLDTFPTGKIGFLTEKAIMDLQHFKNLSEVNHNLGITIIGPKTIKELNKLKERMSNPDFKSRSGLPEINDNDRTDFSQKRINQINKELQIRKNTYQNYNEDLVPRLPIIKPQKSKNLLKILGEAVISIKSSEK